MPCSKENYKRLAIRKKAKYLILGNDKFPNQATGIAFCKESWTELTKKNCSGFYLLQSLGIKIDQARRKYPDGASDLFCLMLNCGLLCWNVKELGSLFNLGLPNKSIKVLSVAPKPQSVMTILNLSAYVKNFHFTYQDTLVAKALAPMTMNMFGINFGKDPALSSANYRQYIRM